MIILKTRSEVNVTVTRKWYVTLHHPMMHSHTKFLIPTSKNIRYVPDSMPILETLSEVKAILTQGW